MITKQTMIRLVMLILCPTVVLAEACTYTEAQIALQQGNKKRALTLMQMAAKDGDRRAIEYLKNGVAIVTQPVIMAELPKKSIFLP